MLVEVYRKSTTFDFFSSYFYLIQINNFSTANSKRFASFKSNISYSKENYLL